MTRVGDLAELLERERAAIVAEPSAESVCDKVVRLPADRSEQERVEREATGVAETLLAWPLLARRLDAFYRTIESKRSDHAP